MCSVSDVVIKELAVRKAEIEKELELLFKSNMKITDWDVPEVNNKEAAEFLFEMMQKKLDSIKMDIESGKYDN